MKFDTVIKGLILVVLLLFFQATPLAEVVTLDPFYLFMLAAVLQWGAYGAIGGGLGCGLLACTLTPFSPFEMAFFYALNGYFLYLLLDSSDVRDLLQACKVSVLGATVYLITSNSLVLQEGLTEMRWWNFSSFLPHLLGMLLVLTAAQRLGLRSGRAFEGLR